MMTLEELKAKGWKNLNREERKQYVALKNPPKTDEIPKDVPSVVSEPVAPITKNLEAIIESPFSPVATLKKIHSQVKDSDDKGSIFQFIINPAISVLSPEKLKEELFKVVKDGDSRSVIHTYL